jgi:hypothetical protein
LQLVEELQLTTLLMQEEVAEVLEDYSQALLLYLLVVRLL